MGNSENMTVMDKLEAYLETAKITIKSSTLSVYRRYMVSYIEPYFRDTPYKNLSSDKLQAFIAELMDSGLAPVTVQAVYSFLKAGLKPSGKDAMFDVSLPKRVKQEVEYLSVDEQRRVEAAAMAAKPPFGIGIILAFYTGIRVGELCGLMWEDVDFERKTLHVRRTLQRIREANGNKKTKIIITPPKSPTSVRDIPLPGFLLELLRQRKEAVQGEYVLSYDNGRHLEPRYVQSHFKSVLKAANVRDVNFHTIRHTFATRALENGFDVKALSEILGHSSATVTLDKYAHVLDEHKRNLMEKMAGNLWNPTK